MEAPGNPKAARARRAAGGPRAAVLGSLTIPGHPAQVAAARHFVVRTLSANQGDADAHTAALLTSEIVTNAIQHSRSGAEGGTATIVVIRLPRGILVEVIDGGSAGAPIVQGDLYAAQGHGLFLVQGLAAEWGYHRDPASTTVWFHLPIEDDQEQAVRPPGQDASRNLDRPGRAEERLPGAEPHRTGAKAHRNRPAQRRAVAMPSASSVG